jgi:hypothetical protein
MVAGLILCLAPVPAIGGDDTAPRKPAIRPDDPAARAFLKKAEEQSPSWSGFPGFEAQLKVYFEGKTHEGKVEVGPNRRVKVSLSDPESRKWVVSTLNSMLSSAARKPFEERYEGIGIVFGKDDLHPLGQLVELHGDPYNTRHRIRDGEFRTTRRTLKEHEVAINVINIDRDATGRKKSRSFVVSYFDKTTGELRKAEAIREERFLLGGYPLPALWVESDVRRDRNGTRTMTLTGHQLLPPPKEKIVSSR